MKIGKEEIFAIIECACFLVGAIFFAYVFIDSSNPLWALFVGLVFAVAGLALWLIPFTVKAVQNFIAQARRLPEPSTLVGDAATDDTYELHRPVPEDDPNTTPTDSDNATDDFSKLDLDF